MELNIAPITAIFGILGGILGILNQLTNLRKQQEEVIKKQAERDKDVEDRLGRIEERLNSHNSYPEKFASLTEAIVEMKTDIKWIKESK